MKRYNLKYFLFLMGAVILITTLLYTNYLAAHLKKSELKNAELYKDAFDYILNNPDYNADISFQEKVKNSFALPIIIKDELGGFTGANFGPEQDQDSLFLASKVKQFLEAGYQPMVSSTAGYAAEIYYFNSPVLDYIRYFPYIQLGLITAFMALGYYIFNASRRAEQNRVWVGMAKETAHQLGTPISAIIAWLINLKESTILSEDQEMIVEELKHDVDRLELVADRFSKIGSLPELTNTDIGSEILNMQSYMAKRAPRKVNFEFSECIEATYFAKVNAHLFNWVVENLMRNSLDSMDGEGTLKGRTYALDNYVYVEIEDNGKGIPPNKFKTVFQPGYSTKKRGWGLGLSLAKRIIEEYHKGRIYVKSSTPGKSTVFAVKIPV